MSEGGHDRELIVRVNAGEGPLRGSIEDGRGRQEFWGWLELLQAFQSPASDHPRDGDRGGSQRHAQGGGE